MPSHLMRAATVFTCAALCTAQLSACSKGASRGDEPERGAAAQGGEAPEAEAASTPKGEAADAKATAGADKPGKTDQGKAADEAKPAPAKSPVASPWGSPDADSGRPLPPRSKLEGKAKSAYEDGLEAARAGDLAKARKAFEAALKDDGNSYLALYALGVVSDREGKESQAIDFYRRSLRAQPDYELAAKGIATIHLRQGQPDKARQFLQPLAAQWERNLHLQAIYADTLVQLGQPAEAITVARNALRRDEKFVPAMLSLVRANLRAGRVELADSILDQALAIDDKNAELHYYMGKRHLEEQRLAEALTEFKKAVDLDPDYAEARMELGSRYLAGANYSEALVQFQAVEKLSPKLFEVHLALGDAYRSTKQWEKAKTSFDKALRMKSDLAQAHYNLALMYMTAGAEFPGMDLLTALAKAKDEFGTYRGMMGSRLTRDDPSSAYLDDIEKAVAREQKRIEREKKAAEKAARKDAAAKPADTAKPADAAKPAEGSAK